MWEDLATVLEQTHHVITLDAPGHGASSWTNENPMSTYTKDAAALADHLGLSELSIVGLSMGGQAAMRLALEMPDRITKLFLANTSPGRGLDPHEATQRGRSEHAAIGTAAFARAYVDSRLAHPATARLRDAYVGWVEAVLPDVYFDTLGAILQADLGSQIAQITQTTRIVTGETDESTPPATAHRLADLIPGASVTVIPDAGHFSVLDQPASFCALVRSWID